MGLNLPWVCWIKYKLTVQWERSSDITLLVEVRLLFRGCYSIESLQPAAEILTRSDPSGFDSRSAPLEDLRLWSNGC